MWRVNIDKQQAKLQRSNLLLSMAA